MDYSSKKLYWIAFAIRVILGVVFVYAAYVKLKDPWELFALAISQYQLLPLTMVEFVARSLPWFELLLGILLLTGRWLRFSATAVSVLLLTFFVLMVRADLQGMAINCGCFGGTDDVISWKTLLRDGSLLAASIALTVWSFVRPRKKA
jgi:putative oxidoreductase